jgi:hypothetical protein
LFEGVIAIQRTLVLLIFNFVEQILAFAILYVSFGVIDEKCATWQRAVCFSASTAATLDYPGCQPSDGGRALMALHVFMTLGLVGISLAYTVSRLTELKEGKVPTSASDHIEEFDIQRTTIDLPVFIIWALVIVFGAIALISHIWPSAE